MPAPPLPAPGPKKESPLTDSDLADLDLDDDACVTKANFAAMAQRASRQAQANLLKSKAVRTALDATPLRGIQTRHFRTRKPEQKAGG